MKLIALTLLAAVAVVNAQDDIKTSADRGKTIYMTSCGTCHMPTGLGVPPAFPPLAKTEYVTENTRRLVAIVIKGIIGPLTVDGKVYNSVMLPAELTFPALKDDKNVADVLNYVRTSFGNAATEAITPEFVAEVRKEFAARTTQWTEAELKAFPAKGAAPAAPEAK